MPPCTNGLALMNMAQSTSQDASYKKTVLLPIFLFFTQKKNLQAVAAQPQNFALLWSPHLLAVLITWDTGQLMVQDVPY